MFIILIDGQSGAGKTTYAQGLFERLLREHPHTLKNLGTPHDPWAAGSCGNAPPPVVSPNTRHTEEPELQLIHLDDFYPGWAGLQAATRMLADTVLDPVAPGYRRWDWHNDQPGEWASLKPQVPMIIEGSGSLSSATLRAAHQLTTEVLTIRITGERELRRQRALERDPFYEPFWDMWSEQEEEHQRINGMIPADLELHIS